MKSAAAVFCLICCFITVAAQTRVRNNGRQVFLSGSNVAWVSFARDVGPDATNLASFRAIFDSVRAHNGNVMRLWLHTNGASSPAFGSNGRVTGPGVNTIADIKAIIDLARERNIGLMLCLWSFDMLRTSYGTGITDRNMSMLNDTSYTMAYVNNALIPIVGALKGYPGIQSWEIFNEPEGMSDEFGWDFTRHVPMASIQRFINLTTGAIHRTDTSALVTNGSWSFKAQTDAATAQTSVSVMKNSIRAEFKLHYGSDIQIDELLAKVAEAPNKNYYRDDRLIALGGDSLGTLDFYTVHYYDWAGTALSPFHHPCVAWGLDKPLVAAEFYVNDTFGRPYNALYDILYTTGYAGALSWSWTDNAVNAVQQFRTKQVMDDLFSRYPWDIDIDPARGKIYTFTGSVSAIESGDTAELAWKTSIGTTALLNGAPVPYNGVLRVTPVKTTAYTLAASGTVSASRTVTVTVHPSGRILSFSALPKVIAPGEMTSLHWNTANGSLVRLNGVLVRGDDSLTVSPGATTTYTLVAGGEIVDSGSITVIVTAEELINRAVNKSVAAVSNSATDPLSRVSNLVDGNINTSWTSAAFEAQSIVVDLQKDYAIGRMFLRWTGNHAAKYRIAVSRDNAQWTLVKTQSGGTGGIEYLDSLRGTGRYVKLLLDKTASGGVYGLYEIEVYGSTPTGWARNDDPALPSEFAVFQNYPNPFNPATVISYELPRQSHVELSVFSILGKKVSVLVDTQKPAGRHSVRFDGSSLPSGVYLYTLRAGDHVTTHKMVLMK